MVQKVLIACCHCQSLHGPSTHHGDRGGTDVEAFIRDWSDERAGRRGFLYRDASGDYFLGEVRGAGVITDDSRAFTGHSEFSVSFDPDNDGVILRQFLDQAGPPHGALVEINGEKAGVWLHPEQNKWHRLADSDFHISSGLTKGLSHLHIRIVPMAEWNAYKYEVHSLVKRVQE